MYIRWKTQSRAPEWELRPGAEWRTKTKPVTLYVAYLVESLRVDGKPRQKQRYLASIKDDRIESASARFYFWQTVQRKFQSCNLPVEQQHMLKTKLRERVPDVTQGQINESNRQMAAATAQLRAVLGKE